VKRDLNPLIPKVLKRITPTILRGLKIKTNMNKVYNHFMIHKSSGIPSGLLETMNNGNPTKIISKNSNQKIFLNIVSPFDFFSDV
jgi:hypothetical protein